MKKRVLALALSLTLCLGLCVVPAEAYSMGKVGESNVIDIQNIYGAHAACIDENGSLWTWGSNSRGKLGNGTTTDSDIPVKVLDNVISMSCADTQTAAIKADGTLWAWGASNGRGADMSKNATHLPVQVMDNVAAVSYGAKHTAAIKTDGTLWMWGNNGSDQLGNGGTGDATYSGDPIQTVPVKVLDNVTAVSAGWKHTAAIKTDGTLWTWGDNGHGQLGNGGVGNVHKKSGKKVTLQDVPVQVLDNVAAVSCGGYHTAAIKTDGTLWIWGSNGDGRLGNGTTESSTVPVKIMDNVAAVSCGQDHTAVIKTDGTLWTWGGNGYGQLGNGTMERSTAPVKIMDNVTTVSAGWNHTAAVKGDGTLWTWGYNEDGELGNGGGGNAANPNGIPIQTLPLQITLGGGVRAKVVSRSTVPAPAPAPAPAANLAYASTQSVRVDGKAVEFQCYALKDENGNPTNYIKLRDLAALLNGSAAQFEVGWDGGVTITTKTAYTPNGSELSTPYSGDRAYQETAAATKVNGQTADLAAFVLNDDNGGGYTYYQLRDLGKALGFNVGWSADKGIFIETDKPYTDND